MNNRKVVVVDGSPFMLQMADSIITKAGFKPVTATTFSEANIHILSAPLPVLVLVDMELPLAGDDHAARTLKDRLLARNIPILLMAREREVQMQDLCAESGADGYLIKPLTSEKFQAAVTRHVGRK